jgi:hypothetical protein
MQLLYTQVEFCKICTYSNERRHVQYAWEVCNTYLERKRKVIQIKHTITELASTTPLTDLKGPKNTWTAGGLD